MKIAISRRLLPRYSLRTALLGLTAATIVVAVFVGSIRRQEIAAGCIRAHGGSVHYKWDTRLDCGEHLRREAFCRRFGLSEDWIREVEFIELPLESINATRDAILRLATLRTVRVQGDPIDSLPIKYLEFKTEMLRLRPELDCQFCYIDDKQQWHVLDQ